MKFSSWLFPGVTCAVLLSAQLCGAETRVIEASLNGAIVGVNLSSSDVGTEEVIVHGISKGRDALAGSLNIQAPEGATARLELRPLSGTIAPDATAATGWISVPVRIAGGREREVLQFGSPTTGAVTMSALTGLCASIPTSYWNELRNYYALGCPNDPQPPTLERLCAWVLSEGERDVSATPTPTPSLPGNTGGNEPDPVGGATVSGSFILMKDSCNRRAKRYLVRLVIDLRGVAASAFESGFSISASVNLQRYRGRKAATIKPESEGKFAPRPLLLMHTLGSYSYFGGGESIDLVRWRRGRISSVKSIRIEDYVYYNGMILTRSVIDRELTGGKGSFVISNGTSAYGLCLRLQRRRSYAGSYR